MKIIKSKNASNQRRQRGIVMVEFIIVAPVILLIALAVAELGNAIATYNTMTQSLRNGARLLAQYASVGSAGNTVIDLNSENLSGRVKNLVAYGVEGTGTSVVPGLAPGNVSITHLGDGILTIQVAYPYQPLLAGGIPRLNGTGSINNLYTLRAEMIVRAL